MTNGSKNNDENAPSILHQVIGLNNTTVNYFKGDNLDIVIYLYNYYYYQSAHSCIISSKSVQ